jgi:multidrug resistance efflux pump
MLRKYLLPVLAAGLLLFAVYHVVLAQQSKPKALPPVPPAQTPFGATVAGSGIVEAQTENIAIGSHLPGVVVEVFVKVGQKVRAGDGLFRLDDRALKAEWAVRQANLAAAEAQLTRQDLMPRAEELPASEAKVREAEANLADHEDQLRRARTANNRQSGAVTSEELSRHQQAVLMAREQLARARADDNLLKAGSWSADKEVARATVAQAKAQLEQTQIDLDRLHVLASVDGQVLQVNVRPGEYVGAPPGQALIVLGNITRLHVRVDIDEHDIPRFVKGAPARAMLRGNPGEAFGLTFVRVEPFVVPKKSLTGDNTERVDTRVLQVIYALEAKDDRPVYVGQQVDVFVASSGTTTAAR